MSKRFENKTVLVTGAAGGIGRASALGFAEEGANLVLVDIKEEESRETQSLVKAAGADSELLLLDVTAGDAPAKMVAAAVERFGGLDIAHNNCGITGPNVDIAEYPDDGWQQVMDINLNSVFRAMKEEIRAMRQQGKGGAIVNTASVASYLGLKLSVGYVTSKHALLGLTRAAALDVIADGIRINAVCPGIIDTPLLGDTKNNPEMMDFIASVQPIGRMGTPEEVARCVLFMASDEASLMVGHGMLVDGGVTIQ